MFAEIKKRNGRSVPFDPSKITKAIAAAGEATGEFEPAVAERLSRRVMAILEKLYEDAAPGVEDVQDVVEEVLLESPFRATAKAYIVYREQRARARDLAQEANLGLIDGYLDCLDWRVKENSNMSYSLQGLNNYLAGELSKSYWLNKIYPTEIRKAHTEGDFHIHDLGQLSVYCVGWDLQDLLEQGFTGAPGKVASKPAKHLRTALGQITNFFYTLQGEAAGAQAFANFDTLLAPFVRYDGLTYDEVKQALQEFVFNVNVPTRVGFQTPFTNITLDWQVPKHMAAEPVVWGGERQLDAYGDFQEEMNLLNRAFLEVMIEGDANGRVFTFPIPTYNVTKDFDWDDPRLDPLWEVTARYGIPYFANFVNSDMSPDDARSMCCRLRLDTRKLESKGGGLFGANPLTGSIGVVTLNLPRVGKEAADEREFMQRIDRLMNLAKQSLEIKRKLLEDLTGKDLYPYSKFYLRSVHERSGEYWNNHFSTIGLIGMNEAANNLLGEGIETVRGKAFASRVLSHMRERMQEFQEETGNFYNLEATPAEGTAYRLARLDTERFGADSAFAGNGRSAEPFYTNSTQLPVHYQADIFDVLDHQDSLQASYTGGTVVHVFVGEEIHDPESVKRFVQKVCANYRLPYFTLSPTFSISPTHGYLPGRHELCPHSGERCEVYSRVVGYLRPVDQWNDGKQAEFDLRHTYQVAAAEAAKEDSCEYLA
jgi:ribonucleoside-triphosphate reductase